MGSPGAGKSLLIGDITADPLVPAAVIVEEPDVTLWSVDYEDVLREHCRDVPAGAPVEPDSPMTVLGLDSLEIVGLIVDLEERFELEFPDDILTPEVFATPRSLWTALKSRCNLGT